MSKHQNPVIVVPGITATGLRDEYPLDAERVWTLIRRMYDRVTLHPDSLRSKSLKYEARQPSLIRTDEAWSLPYQELVGELRYELASSRSEPTPVYVFAYDWRQPLAAIQEQFAAFVDEVIERTSLLRHYHVGSPSWAKDPKVNLVGHSMGGLIIAGYIKDWETSASVGKVATLGTPFRGSLEALVKLATGEGSVSGERTSPRDREAARLTPSLYHLLPSFKGALTTPGPPRSVFDVRNMQKSTVQTIKTAIEQYSPQPAGALNKATSVLKFMLDEARRHRNYVDDRKLLSNAGMKPSDWLCCIGVGEATRVHATVRIENGSARYDLESMAPKNEGSINTGDGTVPYLGAQPAFVPPESLVLVTDDDFGRFELADRALEAIGGLHGLLPKMNLIQRLIISHFKGKQHGKVWGRRSPEAKTLGWKPPIVGLEFKGS